MDFASFLAPNTTALHSTALFSDYADTSQRTALRPAQEGEAAIGHRLSRFAMHPTILVLASLYAQLIC